MGVLWQCRQNDSLGSFAALKWTRSGLEEASLEVVRTWGVAVQHPYG